MQDRDILLPFAVSLQQNMGCQSMGRGKKEEKKLHFGDANGYHGNLNIIAHQHQQKIGLQSSSALKHRLTQSTINKEADEGDSKVFCNTVVSSK